MACRGHKAHPDTWRHRSHREHAASKHRPDTRTADGVSGFQRLRPGSRGEYARCLFVLPTRQCPLCRIGWAVTVVTITPEQQDAAGDIFEMRLVARGNLAGPEKACNDLRCLAYLTFDTHTESCLTATANINIGASALERRLTTKGSKSLSQRGKLSSLNSLAKRCPLCSAGEYGGTKSTSHQQARPFPPRPRLPTRRSRQAVIR